MQHTLQAPPLEMQPRSGFKATLVHGTGIDRQDGQDMLATPRHDSHELSALES